MQKGYSLIELLMVLATLAVLTAIAVPLMQDALLRASISSVATDAKSIHVAFKRYQMDHHAYPAAGPTFHLDTFNPLTSGGYYDGRVVSMLAGDSADGYDAPANNQEFWLEMTLAYDHSVRFLVADSDNAPLSGGDHMAGVYMYKNGVLHSLNDPVH
jgi:prepilin-type N-terminal cleavage/methylation domain-containing protein